MAEESGLHASTGWAAAALDGDAIHRARFGNDRPQIAQMLRQGTWYCRRFPVLRDWRRRILGWKGDRARAAVHEITQKAAGALKIVFDGYGGIP